MKFNPTQCTCCGKYDEDLDKDGICINCESDFSKVEDDLYENYEQYLMKDLDNEDDYFDDDLLDCGWYNHDPYDIYEMDDDIEEDIEDSVAVR